MYISKVSIKNYRLMKDFQLDFSTDEDNFLVLVGRNNTAKTSLLDLLDDVLNNDLKQAGFDDIPLDVRQSIITALMPDSAMSDNDRIKLLNDAAISLEVKIDYSDDSGDMSRLPILSLDGGDCVTIKIIKKFNVDKIPALRQELDNTNVEAVDFLSKFSRDYMMVECVAIQGDNTREYKSGDFDQKFFGLQNLIKLYTISAKRGVANEIRKEGGQDTLSKYAQSYVKEKVDGDVFRQLQQSIIKTDDLLTKRYNGKDGEVGVFSTVINDIKGFIQGRDTGNISVRSNIAMNSILGYGNSRVYYGEGNNRLPETRSGLGYMNMYAIIIKLRMIIDEIQQNSTSGMPALEHIIYIEEPEAHTHPQMQYVFANSIKQFITDNTKDIRTITFITTHSPHFVSQFKEIDDMVLMKRDNDSVKAVKVSQAYNGQFSEYESFIKQYLTVHRSELFFADKLILVEGDTERILIPYFMDLYDRDEKSQQKLLSQYVSVVDVGNYMYIFGNLIKLLGIKTLMITDMDYANKGKSRRLQACSSDKADDTTNPTLKKLLPATKEPDKSTIDRIRDMQYDGLIFSVSDKGYILSTDGHIRLATQKEENGYCARTFEDSFAYLNKDWIMDQRKNRKFINSVKKKISNLTNVDFKFGKDYIKSKAMFAIDIINENEKSGQKIQVPEYIMEGLKWIAKE